MGKSVLHRVLTWWQRLKELAERLEQERRADQTAAPNRVYKIVGAIVLATFMLTLVRYRNSYRDPLCDLLFAPFTEIPARKIFADKQYGELYSMIFWCGVILLFYLTLPALYARLVGPREKMRDYGLGIGNALHHWRLYSVLFGFMVPILLLVSRTQGFITKYPLYRFAHRSAVDFASWELLYLLQFLAIEFFFRGFLINVFRRRLGLYAVLMSVLPYVMIHFGKPMAEALAASVAGLVLGTLALYTRSIWPGVAIHFAVAISMDLLAMQAKGQL